ncbi:hypothetical protein Y032_0359g3421 [Ancylostoma ceylanicum]|uniref:Uncharacterized protein n=1 Tax=Ancylostoma ceylanicum TaxID=53326 RepID=A0A016RVP9_9BILA|nr:hypothetical protein Y032_0359g3421 [Ancylostoma ceylanicum]
MDHLCDAVLECWLPSQAAPSASKSYRFRRMRSMLMHDLDSRQTGSDPDPEKGLKVFETYYDRWDQHVEKVQDLLMAQLQNWGGTGLLKMRVRERRVERRCSTMTLARFRDDLSPI